MCHYVNDYSKLGSYARELEKKMEVLKAKVNATNSTKSSLEAKVAHLNEAVSDRRRKLVAVED